MKQQKQNAAMIALGLATHAPGRNGARTRCGTSSDRIATALDDINCSRCMKDRDGCAAAFGWVRQSVSYQRDNWSATNMGSGLWRIDRRESGATGEWIRVDAGRLETRREALAFIERALSRQNA